MSCIDENIQRELYKTYLLVKDAIEQEIISIQTHKEISDYFLDQLKLGNPVAEEVFEVFFNLYKDFKEETVSLDEKDFKEKMVLIDEKDFFQNLLTRWEKDFKEETLLPDEKDLFQKSLTWLKKNRELEI